MIVARQALLLVVAVVLLGSCQKLPTEQISIHVTIKSRNLEEISKFSAVIATKLSMKMSQEKFDYGWPEGQLISIDLKGEGSFISIQNESKGFCGRVEDPERPVFYYSVLSILIASPNKRDQKQMVDTLKQTAHDFGGTVFLESTELCKSISASTA